MAFAASHGRPLLSMCQDGSGRPRASVIELPPPSPISSRRNVPFGTSVAKRTLWARKGRHPAAQPATRKSHLAIGASSSSSSSRQLPEDSGLGVVITGGTKGVGYALADEFLQRGDRVLICGRDRERMSQAVATLREIHGKEAKVFGEVCDVSSPAQVANLAASAKQNLGTVHHWINNAGMASRTRCNLIDMEPQEILEVSGTNVTGSLLCCRVAVKLMREQAESTSPKYHIYNCGFSSWGASFSSSTAPHKATKRALSQLTDTLSQELQSSGITWVGVHQLSPGMVLTDLLLEEATPGARRFFNVMAEEPETVAAALVPKIRSMQGTAGSVEFLTPLDAFRRVVTGIPAIVNGGRFFDKNGERVKQPDASYRANGARNQF